jgi:hypothetical protein
MDLRLSDLTGSTTGVYQTRRGLARVLRVTVTSCLFVGVVRRWPWPSCPLVAAVSAAVAMTRAETNVAGALAWGGTEAAVVVAGFLVLGPILDLRGSENGAVG